MLEIMKEKSILRTMVFAILMTMTIWLMPANVQKSNAASTLNSPKVESNGNVTWDCVWFGNYVQSSERDSDGNSQKDPIKWRVLCVNENEALLLADKSLLYARHGKSESEFTWETSLIRKKLNDHNDEWSFLNMAFSSNEQSAICEKTIQNPDNPEYKTKGGNATKDKIFCLSIEEMSNPAYGFPTDCNIASETRKAEVTDYIRKRRLSKVSTYWLRSPGFNSKSANLVNSYGVAKLGGTSGDNTFNVRPALWLDLSSDVWSYAGTVSAKMGTAPKKVKAATVAKPKKPTLKKVSSTKKGTLTAIWKRDSKATGYQLTIAQNKKFTKGKKSVTISKNKTTKKTIKKLKSKKIYYTKVRAYKKSGNKKVYGAYSKIKKVKIK